MTTPEPVSLAARLERVEAILRAAKMHEPECPAGHDCARSNCGVHHYPQPCVCWLAP